MGERTPKAWALAPALVRSLQLREAREALAAGDSATALLHAERALDRTPDDPDILRIVADAALQGGLGGLASVTLDQLEALGQPAGAARAEATMLQNKLDEAWEQALAVRDASPQDPAAWAIVSTLVELRGGPQADADAAWDTAHGLAPARFPARLDPIDWPTLYAHALDTLAAEQHARLDAVPLRWEDHPDAATLRAARPPLPPTTPWALSPEEPPQILLFRLNLRRGVPSVEELRSRVQAVLVDVALSLEPPEAALSDDPPALGGESDPESEESET